MGTTVRHLGGALALWYVTERRRGGSEKIAGISRRLRLAAEQLGPTYIKLGQIVASGDGIFPAELVAEFKWCRDRVRPEPWPVVERVLVEELGRPLSEVFSSIDHDPLAAASIAQVHAARLLNGTEVVVKVQRPSVAQRVRQDLAVMSWLAPHLVGRIPIAALANPPALVELFAETIVEELDFRLEAENMLDIASTFAKLGQRDFVGPSSPSHARHAADAGHGAIERLQLFGRRRHACRGYRHRSRRQKRHDRVSRRRHDVRRLSWRLARRESVHSSFGEDRTPRLRDHRTAQRIQASGAPLPHRSARPTGTSRHRSPHCATSEHCPRTRTSTP